MKKTIDTVLLVMMNKRNKNRNSLCQYLFLPFKFKRLIKNVFPTNCMNKKNKKFFLNKVKVKSSFNCNKNIFSNFFPVKL